MQRVVDLNHRYALDGRDPSSYGGILWCFGQFDRPFEPEQPRIGTVRPRPLQEHAKRLDLDAYSRMVNRPRFQTSPRIAMVGAGLGGSWLLASSKIMASTFAYSKNREDLEADLLRVVFMATYSSITVRST